VRKKGPISHLNDNLGIINQIVKTLIPLYITINVLHFISMGILNFIKNIIENARGNKPIQEAHILRQDIKESPECWKIEHRKKYYKLRFISDLDTVEYEAIIKEIDNALKGLPYDECICFDWADTDLTFNYPSVELCGEITLMTEFRLLLLEWIDYRKQNTMADRIFD
jgi:hypothetical protein